MAFRLLATPLFCSPSRHSAFQVGSVDSSSGLQGRPSMGGSTEKHGASYGGYPGDGYGGLGASNVSTTAPSRVGAGPPPLPGARRRLSYQEENLDQDYFLQARRARIRELQREN